MVNISTANPSKKSFPTPQANFDWPMSLSLFGLPTGQKQKGQRLSASAQLYSHSLRRSGRSPALPYPPHEWPQSITLFPRPLKKGTSLLCYKGDISTLG